jgi:hypothetical protein
MIQNIRIELSPVGALEVGAIATRFLAILCMMNGRYWLDVPNSHGFVIELDAYIVYQAFDAPMLSDSWLSSGNLTGVVGEGAVHPQLLLVHLHHLHGPATGA